MAVAKTALWIAEAQMLQETAQILHHEPNFLPLKDYNGIVEGNALRMDWGRLLTSDAGRQELHKSEVLSPKSRYSHDTTFYTLSLSKKNTLATPITTAPASANAESEAMPELMEKCAFIQPRTAGPDAPITLPPHPNTPTAAAR